MGEREREMEIVPLSAGEWEREGDIVILFLSVCRSVIQCVLRKNNVVTAVTVTYWMISLPLPGDDNKIRARYTAIKRSAVLLITIP